MQRDSEYISMFLSWATSDGIGLGEMWFSGDEVECTRDYVNGMSLE